jgi:hypothetical protein
MNKFAAESQCLAQLVCLPTHKVMFSAHVHQTCTCRSKQCKLTATQQPCRSGNHAHFHVELPASDDRAEDYSKTGPRPYIKAQPICCRLAQQVSEAWLAVAQQRPEAQLAVAQVFEAWLSVAQVVPEAVTQQVSAAWLAVAQQIPEAWLAEWQRGQSWRPHAEGWSQQEPPHLTPHPDPLCAPSWMHHRPAADAHTPGCRSLLPSVVQSDHSQLCCRCT